MPNPTLGLQTSATQRLEKITTKNCVFLYFILLFVASYGFAQTDSGSFSGLASTPGELIVRLRSDASVAQLQSLSNQLGAASVSPVFSPTTPAGRHPRLRRAYLIRFPSGWDLEPLRHRYARHASIEAVEMNRLNRFCEATKPSDPRYGEQWNLDALNLPQAWGIEQGAPDVTVAVVDSGIARQHPELRAQLWQNPGEIPNNGLDDDDNGYVDDINGWDFSDAPTLQGHGDWTERDNEPDDETGHGTHVSGIIAAEANNRIGIAGIAWGCRLMPLRAGFKIGPGAFLQNDDLAAAIAYAADNGAQVINMSWGDTVNAFIIEDAVAYAYYRRCVLVAAAGNSQALGSYYPAALETVLSVAGLERSGQLGVSNFGASIDIAAPGDEILSVDMEQPYAYRSGTSMAAAHVSGVAALVLSANPTCANTEIHQWLTGTAREISLTSVVGAGLVDAYAALTVQTGLIAQIAVRRTPQIEIFGNAGGTEFAGYWLEFGTSETPALWYPIGHPQTKPKSNAILHEWDTSTLAEGMYTLRLSVTAENGNIVRDKVVVEVRHTTPLISKHEAGGWFSGNHFDSIIIWQTDELTTGEVEIFSGTDIPGNVGRTLGKHPLRVTRSDSVNRQHLVYLSDLGLPPGEYLYRLIARNRAGLRRIDDNDGALYQLAVREEHIQPAHLSPVASVGPGLHAIVATVDINRNGHLELIAVETDTVGWTSPQIFEVGNNGTYKPIFSLPESLWPWATADTDGDGLIELLGNAFGTTFLLEQPAPGKFPTERIWEAPGIWGGTIVDADADGSPEIFSRHDATNSIWIYEANGDNSYHNITILENPTQGKNGIGTRFATGDFDGDGQMEILAADQDGEVFIYENVGDNRYKQTWIDTLPASIPQLFAAGDMNGDGTPEFAVGAKVWTTEPDITRQHWLFTVFTSDSDNTYRAVWSQRIRNISDGGNGLTIADANNDGQNELCIAVSPNFYLVQYNGIDYCPIWHHPATSTFNPIVADVDGDGANELLFNSENAFAVFKALQQVGISEGLPSPWGISAKPVDETSIRLMWQAAPDAVTHTLYRRQGQESPKSIREGIRGTHFMDTGLTPGQTYWYALESRGSNGKLSKQSAWVPVVPTPAPRMSSAVYSPPHQLLLRFDKPMGPAAAQPAQYRLHRQKNDNITRNPIAQRASSTEINSTGNYAPRSAMLDKSLQRVVLTFPSGVFRTDNRYQIETLQLADIHGAPIAADARMLPVAFSVQPLTEAIVYPNPAGGNQVTFARLPEGTRIYVYDMGGNCIASLVTTEVDRCQKIWYVTDVSSGVYIYVLEAGTDRHVGKLSIIR